MKTNLLLCIPGTWLDRSDFIARLANETDCKFTAAGNIILDNETGFGCEFEIFSAVEGMDADFRIGSLVDPIPENILDDVGRHSTYVCLYSKQDPASEAVAVSQIALAILDSGGISVRVEGSKRASSPSQWRDGVQLAQTLGPVAIYKLFVWAFVADGTTFNTIGMTFLGHPDIAIEADSIEAANVIYNEFAKYLLIQNPEIIDGHTIEFEDIGGVWQMHKVPHIYAEDPDIDFDRGMWKLIQVRDTPEKKRAFFERVRSKLAIF